MPDLALKHLTKVYPNGVAAVRDMNLVIADGELLALVGPSGCGKTTTLRLIAGLEEPTEGTIRLGGRDLTGVPPRKRNVAMVFQRPAIFPKQTVSANLQFALRLRKPWDFFRRFFSPQQARQEKERIVRIASLLGLENELSRYPSELSGGQQQRLALGRALVRQAGLLLLDEPLGHLDGPLRLDLRRQLHLLHRQFPATMIHVTHDPEEALALADRVAVLDGGMVQQVDAPENVFQRPANRRVARIMCHKLGPMNFLDGRFEGEKDDLAFRCEGGMVIALSVQDMPGLLSWRGREITLGVRPEDVEIASNKTPQGVLSLRVDLIESRGDSVLATCSGPGLRVCGLVKEGRKVAEGDHVMVAVAWQKALCFDRVSGQALAPLTLPSPPLWGRGQGEGAGPDQERKPG